MTEQASPPTPTAVAFAQQGRDQTPRSAVPAPTLLWEFKPEQSMDYHFQALTAHFGKQVIMEMDEVVLDTPVQAAIRATKIYRHYSAQIGQEDKARQVMEDLAKEVKAIANVANNDALLPPEAVFQGFDRPKP